MSSEQFDKHIKNKLESVRPPYNDAAWKNFRKILPLPWYVAFYREYKGWLYSSVCTIAVITTSYLLYNQRKENQELNAKITTLNNQVSKNQITDKGQTIPYSPDTSRTTQKIRAVPPALPEVPDKPISANREEGYNQINTVPKGVIEDNAVQENNRSAVIGLANPTTGLSNRIKNSGSSQQIKNNRQTSAQGIAGNLNNPGNNTRNQVKLDINSFAQDSLNELKTGIINAPKANDANQGQVLPNKNTDLVKTQAASPDSAVTAVTPLAAPADTAGQKKSAAGLTSLNARLGIGSDFNGAPKFAFGPVLELLFSSRLSLNTGILFAAPQETRLQQPQDYNKVTGKKFEDVYRPHMPRYDRIRDIKLRTSSIKMPIGLNYYFPATGNLSFMAMAGTKLDLSVDEKVEFKSSFQGEERLNRFETKPKAHTFNDMFLGVGLQYKYGRLVGQVAPYFNLYFRDPKNFSQPGRFGLNVSLKVDLRK